MYYFLEFLLHLWYPERTIVKRQTKAILTNVFRIINTKTGSIKNEKFY